jgi:hypothetical protein
MIAGSSQRGHIALGISLPRPERVRLEVYDILGRRLVTLVDGRIRAGTTTIQWDVSRAVPGIVCVRFTHEDGSITKRVAILH